MNGATTPVMGRLATDPLPPDAGLRILHSAPDKPKRKRVHPRIALNALEHAAVLHPDRLAGFLSRTGLLVSNPMAAIDGWGPTRSTCPTLSSAATKAAPANDVAQRSPRGRPADSKHGFRGAA